MSKENEQEIAVKVMEAAAGIFNEIDTESVGRIDEAKFAVFF